MAGGGKGSNTKKRKATAAAAAAATVAIQPSMLNFFAPKEQRPRQIFCDLDGVLVDFSRAVLDLIGEIPKESNKVKMWAAINKVPHFYRDMEWMEDGRELWEAIRHLQPTILTGISNSPNVSNDKFDWCKRELCADAHWRDMAAPQKKHMRAPRKGHPRANDEAKKITIVTCWSGNKHLECREGDILIDDRPEKLQKNWENARGIFVHHVSTPETLRKLRTLGILSDEDKVANALPPLESDTTVTDSIENVEAPSNESVEEPSE